MGNAQYDSARQVIHRFWAALDHRDYQTLIRYVTEHCRWSRGAWVEGRAGILASLHARPLGLTTRHLVSNLVIDAEGEKLTAKFVLVAYGHDANEHESVPFASAAPALIADIVMRLDRTDTGWQISTIEPADVIFKAAA